MNATASAGSAPYTYAWDVNNDGQYELSGSSASYSFPDNGAYTVRVKVTDSAGASATAAAQVTVSNAPPSAAIDCPSTGTPGESVTFSGSATDPSMADTAAGFQYRWDFGDGQTSNQGITTHVYNTAGVYDVTLTVTDKDGGQGAAATAVTVSSPAAGVSYYIAPNATSGSGTMSDPFGLPDLLNGNTRGHALTILQPGDTLYFRAGTYHIAGNTTDWDRQLISPAFSGTATQPITLSAYPGETVNIIVDSGIQPAMGTYHPSLNYVRFIGFTVTALGNHGTAIAIGGTGCEVGYCEIIGQYSATGDNNNALALTSSVSGWIHHNNIHGSTGIGLNNSCIKMYYGVQNIFEENNTNNCTVGIFDKDTAYTDGATQSIYRRNYVTNGFLGNNQDKQATFHIYDNVITGYINLFNYGMNTEVYNNLIFTSVGGDGNQRAIGGAVNQYNANIWNNIAISGGAAIEGYAAMLVTFTPSGPTAPLAYMDYNVYDGTPSYPFAGSTLSLGQIQAQGFEQHASVASASSIFVDQMSYVLQPQWTTAGKYGDAVGPRYPIAQILNTNRYGPGALN